MANPGRPSVGGPATVRFLRGALFGLFALGAAGTAAELVLLGHYEDLEQWVPLLLIPLTVPLALWWRWGSGRPARRALRALMTAYVLSGGVGIYFHYRANVEFELEMVPSLAALPLAWEALHGATPALAPGAMIELGLLGLAYTYRHPGWGAPNEESGGTG